jgi:glycine cleavage system H protein
MIESDFLTLHGQKAAEYLLGAAYLILFIPFWRFLMTPAPAALRKMADATRSVFDWFRLPDGFFLHPGHVWARAESPGSVTVGLDDFGHRLVGPVSSVLTPSVGEVVRQGEPAISLVADGHRFDLLAPVDGVVAEVNGRADSCPDLLHADPYGSGWILKVVPKRLTDNLHDLLSGDAARRFLESATERLVPRLQPGLVTAQDGGAPIHGIARELDPEHWDDLVRAQFLTK